MTTSAASSSQSSTQLPPAIANLLASTTQQLAITDTPANAPKPTTMPVVEPANNAPLLTQPQSAAPPAPSAQYNIPPLPMFLNMPFPMQQQIFRSVPIHIQQQMLSSLPPPLQNQLGPLMGPNGAPPPPFPPVSMADAYVLLLSICDLQLSNCFDDGTQILEMNLQQKGTEFLSLCPFTALIPCLLRSVSLSKTVTTLFYK